MTLIRRQICCRYETPGKYPRAEHAAALDPRPPALRLLGWRIPSNRGDCAGALMADRRDGWVGKRALGGSTAIAALIAGALALASPAQAQVGGNGGNGGPGATGVGGTAGT